MNPTLRVPVDPTELIQLCAADSLLYCSTFFPKTFRQDFGKFHADVWDLLEDRSHRFLALSLFRGAAKTTLLRTFTSRRVAYGSSHTVLFVSAAQGHSNKSLGWLRTQVETNRAWSETFQLEKGSKWTEDTIQIRNKILDSTSTILSLGITGQTRGINVDDYRPDLIVVDDPCHLAGTLMWTGELWSPVESHPGAREAKWEKGLRVSVQGLPLSEVVTTEHKYQGALPVYSRFNGNRVVSGLTRLDWIKAQDLTPEHYIGTPIEQTEVIPDGLAPELQTEAFWFLAGLWWGDGDLSGNGSTVRWSVSSQAVMIRVLESIRALGFVPSIYTEQANVSRVALHNANLWHWFRGWRDGNSVKFPPAWVLKLPKNLLQELVRGYVLADGCLNGEGTGWRIASKNYHGLVTLSWILAKLGIRNTIRTGRKGGEMVIEDRTVLAHQQWELGFTDRADLFGSVRACRSNFTKSWIEHGMLWRRVKDVVACEIEMPFIPLSVEGGEYCTALGLSHNCDEENTATPEQREKISDLFFGALAKSLTPASECPDAKMVLLQTVLNGEDLISKCLRDPSWASRNYSCFDEHGKSTWPARFSTEVLEKDKADHIWRNQLPLWLREMEGKIVSTESATFRGEWLKYWEVLPEGMVTFIAIDPVPPPSEREIAAGLRDKDYETIAVVGVFGGMRFLLDYSMNRGHTPEWTVNEFFRLVDKWRPIKAKVEGVAYQRTLKWILEEEMKRRLRFIQVDAVTDKRKKSHRITQAFSGPASQGMFYVHKSHAEFYEQFVSYPNVNHDDLLDAVAMAMPGMMETGGIAGVGFDETGVERLPSDWRVAP